MIATSLTWCATATADDRVGLELSVAAEAFAARGLERCCVALGVATAGVDLDLGHATAHVLGFAIHGDGLTAELEDIHGVSNLYADDDVRLYEAWIEHAREAWAIRDGLLAVDQELVIAEHSTLLLDATFGIIGQYSANVVGPVYPVGSPGVSARLGRDDLIVRAAIYDGSLDEVHGVPTGLGGGLGVAEVALAGTMKLGGWIHTDRPDGLYALFDRALHPRAGAFVRFGASPGGPVSVYADAGVRIAPSRRRPEDLASAGVAYSTVAAGDGTARGEVVAEVTYQAVTRWLTVQPDLQLVWQPDRVVPIAGVRAVISR